MIRDINYESLEIDGINFDDYPDFKRACICGGYTRDGEELSDYELEVLSKDKDLIIYIINRRIND
jgi:hypothetical protein